jgi:hypothetical protein
MIEPQNGQRGVIGQQHGLTHLIETLERIERGQRTQEHRETQMQEQWTTQVSTLHQLTRQVAWLRSLVLGLGAMVTLGTGLVGWHATHPPVERYSAPFGALDSTLIQQWEKLPKGTQEALSAIYGRIGMTSPGQRK